MLGFSGFQAKKAIQWKKNKQTKPQPNSFTLIKIKVRKNPATSLGQYHSQNNPTHYN